MSDTEIALIRADLAHIASLAQRSADAVDALRNETVPDITETLAQLREWKKEMDESREATQTKFTENDKEHKEMIAKLYTLVGVQGILTIIAIATSIFRQA